MKSLWKKITLCFALLIASVTTYAQEVSNEVTTLWEKLGIDFGDFFEKVFDAMKLPVGTILAVVFVMAIFYFCIKMARSAINKRNSI